MATRLQKVKVDEHKGNLKTLVVYIQPLDHKDL